MMLGFCRWMKGGKGGKSKDFWWICWLTGADMVIDRVNSTYNPIEINAGTGTKGIYINQGVIKYNNPISGGFYGQLPSLRHLDISACTSLSHCIRPLHSLLEFLRREHA